MASASVNALAAALRESGVEVLKVYPDRNYKPRPSDVIINWGNGRAPNWAEGAKKVLNTPNKVEHTGNKLSAFKIMADYGVSVPSVTESRREAQDWVNDGNVVVTRHVLRGHSGEGIELVGSSIDNGSLTGVVPEAPLYTLYRKKAREYRIHVFNGNVIYWQQKMLRRDFPQEDVNYQVRNHDNGWIYATEAATPPEDIVISQARAAVACLGLSFGAVDVVYNEHHSQASVLEVNTAPGLAGTTITKYRDAILGAL